MLSKELDIRVAEATNQISIMKQSHQTSGEMLGVPSVIKPSEGVSREPAEGLEFRDLGVNGQLAEVDTAVEAMLRELPLGSIVGFSRVKADLHDIPKKFIDQFEIIGAKLTDIPQGSVFWGLVRVDQQGKQLPWRTYQVEGQLISEKEDVIHSLQTLLNPNQGIEASQILSALLQLDSRTNTHIYGDRNISGAGCFSHDQPKRALPVNMLLGSAVPLPRPLVVGQQAKETFVRAYIGEDFSMLPLAHPSDDTVDANHVLRVALVHQSEKVAQTNPTNLGSGTASEKVLEAVYETTQDLPELVGNGASIADAQQVFKNKLGVR